ncbi:GNAT family N-acetyltransferase [Actinoplanes sp. NPDC049802]|uniref:GNAT family N-acetyltransferase n=1 Tax=Actinoplanes sp. NPDC049802 TaxID=3154742 RepID=UPI0033CF4216
MTAVPEAPGAPLQFAATAGALPESEVAGLARRCRAADGGLPLVAEPWFVQGRWGVPGVVSFSVRDGDGTLVGAAAVRPTADGPVVTGLVDPACRGRDIGGHLLDAALAIAETGGRGVTVECEGLTAGAERLFEERGLRRFFAEDVMRTGLDPWEPAPVRLPDGVTLVEWAPETAERFHAVYAAAFRERPGFPDPPAAEWITKNTEDADFRPGWSLLAVLPGIGDAGFVTAADGWIVQVGVLPAARGAGLGGALVRESLRRMAATGAAEAWLCVDVDNPAGGLYRRLGFQEHGRRARYHLAPEPAGEDEAAAG